VLIGCEKSGRLRNLMLEKGHNAISCDIEKNEKGGPHIKGKIEEILGEGWDMIIAFPPCTWLTYTNWRANKNNYEIYKAYKLVKQILETPCSKIAIENPRNNRLTKIIGQYDQWIQPYWFGDDYSKPTGIWKKGLKDLKKTKIVKPKWIIKGNNKYSKIVWNKKNRSIIGMGTLTAIANQWG
jgi:hypothetical protein